MQNDDDAYEPGDPKRSDFMDDRDDKLQAMKDAIVEAGYDLDPVLTEDNEEDDNERDS